MPTTIYRCPVTFPAIPSTGGVVYANAGTDLAVTAAGSAGQVLISNGTGAPSWTSPGSGIGTVTSVGLSVPVGLTVAGSPVTSAGTLAVSLQSGYVIPGGGSSGEVLTSNGASAPTFQAIPAVTPAALTRVDDTNVTVTLGGTPGTALLQATSLTLGWTGTLAVSRGGIGTGTAGIGAFNNITGLSAAGTTGTTSTNLVFSTSPTLVTPTLGVASATTVNKVTITAPATSATLTIPDGVTLNAGAGGTLGSNAFTSTAYLPLAGGTLSGSLLAGTTNTYDIGSSGTRFRSAFFANNLTVGATAFLNAIEIPNSSYIYWATRSLINSPANGQFSFTNNAITIGVGLDVATDATLKVRTRAQTGDASITILNSGLTGYEQFTEMTAPAAGATNTLRLFAQDNGAGKTQLMVLFATGAAQQIAIEA